MKELLRISNDYGRTELIVRNYKDGNITLLAARWDEGVRLNLDTLIKYLFSVLNPELPSPLPNFISGKPFRIEGKHFNITTTAGYSWFGNSVLKYNVRKSHIDFDVTGNAVSIYAVGLRKQFVVALKDSDLRALLLRLCEIKCTS